MLIVPSKDPNEITIRALPYTCIFCGAITADRMMGKPVCRACVLDLIELLDKEEQ